MGREVGINFTSSAEKASLSQITSPHSHELNEQVQTFTDRLTGILGHSVHTGILAPVLVSQNQFWWTISRSHVSVS